MGSHGSNQKDVEKAVQLLASGQINAKRYISKHFTLDQINDALAYHESRQGLKVIVTFDRQEGLEDMTIVRTQNSLQGVRYLHAQFVGQTGESQPQLRNFSFESPKGPNALNNAATVLKSVFQFTEKDRLDDFDHRMIVYRADDYLCYVSELNTDYMVNHPFNAYDLTEDVGVIRWACDKDVHPHHSESH